MYVISTFIGRRVLKNIALNREQSGNNRSLSLERHLFSTNHACLFVMLIMNILEVMIEALGDLVRDK